MDIYGSLIGTILLYNTILPQALVAEVMLPAMGAVTLTLTLIVIANTVEYIGLSGKELQSQKSNL